MEEFQEKIYQAVKKIPAGNVLTYKEVAQKAGYPRAWRAVGNILNKNRVGEKLRPSYYEILLARQFKNKIFDCLTRCDYKNPLIPCHRVIKSNGKIGGYNRGTKKKEILLKKEIIGSLKRFKRNFYTRNTLRVAKELLGKFIIRRWRGKLLIGKIVETEVYIGPQDKASHAYLGKKTPRNLAEYLIGGHIYIYLVYGMYWQLNISTSQAGKPECVLIRALEPVSPLKYRGKLAANGPGKLCQWLKLDKSFYGEDVVKSKKIWLAGGKEKIKKSNIIASKRIGIDYAGEYWANKKWRFYIKNNPFVSQFKPKVEKYFSKK